MKKAIERRRLARLMTRTSAIRRCLAIALLATCPMVARGGEMSPQVRASENVLKGTVQIAPGMGPVAIGMGIAAPIAGMGSTGSATMTTHIQVPCGTNQDPQICQQQGVQAELNNAIWNGQTEEVRQLLNKMKDVSYLSPAKSFSPFVTAVEKGYLEIVKALVEKGADPLARDTRGVSMLAVAIEHAEGGASGISPAMYNCLRLALDKGARDGLLKPVFPLNATLAFARKPDPVLLKFLLDYGADPDAKPLYGSTATETAFAQNQPEMMQIILNSKGHDPQRDLDKLAYRAFLEHKSEMLKVLRAAGGNPVRHAKSDPQALFDALRPERKIEELEFVLQSGANPNVMQNPQTRITPVSQAVLYPDKLRLLIKHGADVNARSFTGGTILVDVLFRSGQNTYAPPGQTAALYPTLEIVRLLLDNGAEVNGNIGGFGQFGALAATRREDKEIIQLLLDHGATLTFRPDPRMAATMAGKNPDDPNLPMPAREGPVMLAMGLERDDLALAILERDKKVDTHDRLALVKAVRKGWGDVAQALLHTGADPNAVGGDGISALAVAKSRHNEVMAQALIAAGAPAATPPAPPFFKSGDPFETLVGNEIDSAVHFDPPSFTLAEGLKELNAFVFYGKINKASKVDSDFFNNFEKVKCERSAGFQFLAHANLTGSILVGTCNSQISRLRELATEAEPALNLLLGAMGASGAKADPEKLKSGGWFYEKSGGKEGPEIYFFPVMVFGHGIMSSSTVLVVPPDRRRAVILQADVMNLCENNRIRTPLCDKMKDTLIDIAQRVLLRAAVK